MYYNYVFFDKGLQYYTKYVIIKQNIIGKLDFMYLKGLNWNMGMHMIPRNVKGEGRLFYIFSVKALIYTVVGLGLGLPFYFILSAAKLGYVGIIISLIFGVIGFIIGTLKIPETDSFEITRKTGGEKIDDIIMRYIKFKKNNKNKIYIYDDGNLKQ